MKGRRPEVRGRDDMVLCPCGGVARLKGGSAGALTFVCDRCGNIIVIPPPGRGGGKGEGERGPAGRRAP